MKTIHKANILRTIAYSYKNNTIPNTPIEDIGLRRLLNLKKDLNSYTAINFKNKYLYGYCDFSKIYGELVNIKFYTYK